MHGEHCLSKLQFQPSSLTVHMHVHTGKYPSHFITISGLPKVIFLTVAEGEGKGGKTSALEVEAEGEAEGLVFCI